YVRVVEDPLDEVPLQKEAVLPKMQEANFPDEPSQPALSSDEGADKVWVDEMTRMMEDDDYGEPGHGRAARDE
ncbi:unnamed protein product, partial [Symbiodinium sp. CCMP2456]